MTAVRIEERSVNGMPASAEDTRRNWFPGIRWGAIFAGMVVGIALQTLFGILGVAGGLSSMASVSSGESSGIGPMLWTIVSMLISAFVGGFFAARMSGSRRKMDGAMYGAVTWAVSMLLFAVVLSTTAGSIMSGMVSNNTTVVYSGSSVTMSPGSVSQLRQELGGELSNANLQQLQQYLQSGQREEAIVYLTSLGIESPRAVSIVNNAMNQMGSTMVGSEQLISPNQLVRAVSAAAWMVFIGVTLSMVVSVIGGIMGAKYAYRPIWGKNGFAHVSKEDKLID